MLLEVEVYYGCIARDRSNLDRLRAQLYLASKIHPPAIDASWNPDSIQFSFVPEKHVYREGERKINGERNIFKRDVLQKLWRLS